MTLQELITDYVTAVVAAIQAIPELAGIRVVSELDRNFIDAIEAGLAGQGIAIAVEGPSIDIAEPLLNLHATIAIHERVTQARSDGGANVSGYAVALKLQTYLSGWAPNEGWSPIVHGSLAPADKSAEYIAWVWSGLTQTVPVALDDGAGADDSGAQSEPVSTALYPSAAFLNPSSGLRKLVWLRGPEGGEQIVIGPATDLAGWDILTNPDTGVKYRLYITGPDGGEQVTIGEVVP